MEYGGPDAPLHEAVCEHAVHRFMRTAVRAFGRPAGRTMSYDLQRAGLALELPMFNGLGINPIFREYDAHADLNGHPNGVCLCRLTL